MKKNVLAMSIATMIGGLGFAGVASAEALAVAAPFSVAAPAAATALRLAPNAAPAHILVVPYFTAQDGNMSVFHVVNTDTVNAKAVKVRFRGASNSDDILDFQVFLSPGDVWTGAVTQGSDGIAQLTTADTSCTVPRITPGSPVKFDTRRINPALTGDALASETREGYVELFTMADIPKVYGAHSDATKVGKANALYATVKHKSNGSAPDCDLAILEDDVSTGGNLTNITSAQDAVDGGFDAPTGSLFGDWYIINGPQSTTFSGSATGIQAVIDPAANPVVLGRGNFVHFPQLAGTVGDALANESTADPLFRNGANNWFTATSYGPNDASVTNGTAPTNTTAAIAASFYDLPDLSTPYVDAVGDIASPLVQAGLLTQALARSSVSNQFSTNADISAKTDWVFSMPTRRYSVAYDYAQTGTAGLRFSKLRTALAAPAGDVVNNAQWFTPALVTVGTGKQICVEAASQAFADREEQRQSAGAVFSPGNVSKTTLCGEASVLTLGGSVLGAKVATQSTTPPYADGWGTVSFKSSGLPVVGFAVTKASNANATPGVAANYGITWQHR